MRTNTFRIVELNESHRLTIVMTTILGVLLFSATVVTGAVAHASNHTEEESVAQATEVDDDVSPVITDAEANLDAFDRMEQAPGLYTAADDEISPRMTGVEDALDLFEKMERAPGLYTESQVVPDRIESNLEAFDRMEQAPDLYPENRDVAERIEANLKLFDKMEQNPGPYTD